MLTCITNGFSYFPFNLMNVQYVCKYIIKSQNFCAVSLKTFRGERGVEPETKGKWMGIVCLMQEGSWRGTRRRFERVSGGKRCCCCNSRCHGGIGGGVERILRRKLGQETSLRTKEMSGNQTFDGVLFCFLFADSVPLGSCWLGCCEIK